MMILQYPVILRSVPMNHVSVDDTNLMKWSNVMTRNIPNNEASLQYSNRWTRIVHSINYDYFDIYYSFPYSYLFIHFYFIYLFKLSIILIKPFCFHRRCSSSSASFSLFTLGYFFLFCLYSQFIVSIFVSFSHHTITFIQLHYFLLYLIIFFIVDIFPSNTFNI